jgi:hypothetical protein
MDTVDNERIITALESVGYGVELSDDKKYVWVSFPSSMSITIDPNSTVTYGADHIRSGDMMGKRIPVAETPHIHDNLSQLEVSYHAGKALLEVFSIMEGKDDRLLTILGIDKSEFINIIETPIEDSDISE